MCVRVTNEVMGEWEESNNEDKERLEGRSERMFASWEAGWGIRRMQETDYKGEKGYGRQ